MNISSEVINFGIIPHHRPSSRHIFLRNGSPEEQEFSFVQQDNGSAGKVEVRIQPESSTVPPGGSLRVMATVTALDSSTTGNPFEVRYDVHMGGKNTPAGLQLMGTFIKQDLEMVVEGADPDVVDLGQVYCGLRKTSKIRLINKGALSLPFCVSIEEAGEVPPGVLEVTPTGGVVEAFDTIILHVSFHPPRYMEEKGFKSTRVAQEIVTQYRCIVKVNSEHLPDLALARPVVGSGIVPALTVSRSSLDFGGCPVCCVFVSGDRRDFVVTLRNEHASLPIDWAVPGISHIRVEPAGGRIGPLMTQEVVITFSPKALGNHQRDIKIMYCENLYSITVYAIGWGETAVGAREKKRKGLEAIAEDFAPRYRFVDEEDVKAQRALASVGKRGGRPVTLTGLLKGGLTGQDFAESSKVLRGVLLDRTGYTTQFTLSPSGMREHLLNREVYNECIRKPPRHDGKSKSREVDIFDEHDIDLGMYRKLKDLRLSVNGIVHDKLYELRPAGGGDTVRYRGVTGRSYTHDDMEAIERKHKSRPSTEAEISDCGQFLEPWQLALISCGPSVLDFGTIFVRSSATRSFSVFNDLASSVVVTVETAAIEELSNSSPVSQVIPSAAAGGFDIVMSSAAVQQFQCPVTVTINGKHKRKFLVKAAVIPVTLNVSESKLDFRVSDDDLNQTLVKRISLSNDGNAAATYAWTVSHPDSFSVRSIDSTTATIICPNSHSVQEIVFTPPADGKPVQGTLTLRVEDGMERIVKVHGHCPSASCRFVTKRCDFGTVACGMIHTRTVIVGNTGQHSAAFRVAEVPVGVEVKPRRGLLPVRGRLGLIVQLTVREPSQIDGNITLAVRAGKPIRVPVQALLALPDIRIVEEELRFGTLTLGGISTTPCTLVNPGIVESAVYANFASYPEFSLEMVNVLDADNEVVDLSDTDVRFMTAMSAEELAAEISGHKNTGTAISDEDTSEHCPGSDGEKPGAYKLVIPPGYTVQTELIYHPREIGSKAFEFPMVLAGGMPVSNELCRIVSAEVLRPR